MNIVRMHEGHLQALASLEAQCFSTPWSMQSLREALARREDIFLVAEGENGAVLGYIGCQIVLDEGYITNVAVFLHERRRGIARKLLTHLDDEAQKIGLHFVTLEVRASNDGAISLYKRQGYRQAGTRREFYRNPSEDAILMTKHF